MSCGTVPAHGNVARQRLVFELHADKAAYQLHDEVSGHPSQRSVCDLFGNAAEPSASDVTNLASVLIERLLELLDVARREAILMEALLEHVQVPLHDQLLLAEMHR